MRALRRKPGTAIGEHQPTAVRHSSGRAMAWLGLAALVLMQAGGSVYTAHLHREHAKAERVIHHLEIGQEALIKDRDTFTGRVLNLEADLEQSEHQATVSQDHVIFLLRERQNLQHDIKQLTNSLASNETPDSVQRGTVDQFQQMIADRDARIRKLESEARRLQVTMYELANAMAINQVMGHSTAGEFERQDEANGCPQSHLGRVEASHPTSANDPGSHDEHWRGQSLSSNELCGRLANG